VLTYPSAFAYNMGNALWEILLCARALALRQHKLAIIMRTIAAGFMPSLWKRGVKYCPIAEECAQKYALF